MTPSVKHLMGKKKKFRSNLCNRAGQANFPFPQLYKFLVPFVFALKEKKNYTSFLGVSVNHYILISASAWILVCFRTSLRSSNFQKKVLPDLTQRAFH